MVFAIVIVLAGCILYWLMKPPSVEHQPEPVRPQDTGASVSYGYEAKSDA
ncbi:hypothetical protein Btus_3121 [Kyrpidia tusciae DSM 2912]|uniref:Uncharacterized protein n=1 Tax=Kyrpidia tusciae (strain DSM 2912 / NBRC 15312 / T2) TaxID=562970 RepID=D5WWH0_KYRT2|nr:hypothetical protein Btus_3121 [Kyrpidia tusciae DSM 2912]